MLWGNKNISIFLLLVSLPILILPNKGSETDTSNKILSNDHSQWVEETLANLSLKEKCAQLVISYASVNDTTVGSKDYQRLVKLVSKYKVGGLILFNGNTEIQVDIMNRLQRMAKIPLIISSDFERGPGMRFDDAINFPNNMAIAAADDPYLTYLMGKVTAEQGRALGVHLNFAPLLDVNHDFRNPVINIRAYSEDKEIISWNGGAFVKGMQEGGMLCTAKHFPGHGATDIDSHRELPLINLSKKQFEEIDLKPFGEAIKSKVKSIMVGHLAVPAYEPDTTLPATLSHKIITGLLREKMRYDGLIITDAMNMNAITNHYEQDEAAKLALLAGNDIVLFPAYDSLAIEGIYNAVLENQISEARIDSSVRKVLAAKEWLKLNEKRFVDSSASKETLSMKWHYRVARDIAEKSVTLVKDKNQLIPLSPNDYKRTACIVFSDTRHRWNIREPYYFEKIAKERFGDFKSYRLNIGSRKRDYSKALKAAKKAKLIILAIYNGASFRQDDLLLPERQLKLIDDLIKLKKPFVVLNFGNPYLFTSFPEAPSYLCSFSSNRLSQEAMLKAILGENKICGKLPVNIPNSSFKIGFGQHREIKNNLIPDYSSEDYFDFSRIDSLMQAGVKDSVFPGGVLLIGHKKKIIYEKAFGHYTYDSTSTKITNNTLFDLASLSKVIGTTSAAMILCDHGVLELDAPVVRYLPAFGENGKTEITIRNLLTHTAGFPSYKRYYAKGFNKDSVYNDIMKLEPISVPGEKYRYSDLSMIALQFVIEKVTGISLDRFLENRLFSPLGLKNTFYKPDKKRMKECVPTEIDTIYRNQLIQGIPHDENAYTMGGVAGHAGLFSSASDLAKIVSLYFNNGKSENTQFFKPNTIDEWVRNNTNKGNRALGWGTQTFDGYSSAGEKFSINSFGHTGFTGTSIWCDRERELFVILLTNRVHPTRANIKIIDFRPRIHDEIIDVISY